MKSLAKYWAIAWISAKSNFAYVGEVGSRLFFLVIILYVFMRLWKATFTNAHATAFGGYDLNGILWYVAMAEAIVMSAPRVTFAIDEDVRTGTLAVQLVRPLSYPLYRLASDFGERTVKFIVTWLAAAGTAMVLAGPPPDACTGLLLFALAIPGAFVLDFLGYLLVGLGAFWMEDTAGLTLIYSRLTMVLGGMLLPLDLFPANFQWFLKALPFGYIVSGPARQFVHPDPIALLALLANQAFWITILAVAAAAIYSRALNRIALNGG